MGEVGLCFSWRWHTRSLIDHVYGSGRIAPNNYKLNYCVFIVTLVVRAFCIIGKYNNWDKVDPAELFSKAPTEKKEANPKLSMVKFLQVRCPRLSV